MFGTNIICGRGYCGVLGLRLFEPRLISGARHYRIILLPSLGPRRHYILTSGMARYRYLDCFICCNTVRLHFVNKLLYISLSSLTSSWQYEDENATKLVSEISFSEEERESNPPALLLLSVLQWRQEILAHILLLCGRRQLGRRCVCQASLKWRRQLWRRCMLFTGSIDYSWIS